MRVLNNNVIYCDVDDTLIIWDKPSTPGEGKVEYTDRTGEVFYGYPNKRLIAKLKKHKQIGKAFIVVWSMSGGAWASDIVDLLGLADTVDLVISKPAKYYDDKPIKNQSWMWELPPEIGHETDS